MGKKKLIYADVVLIGILAIFFAVGLYTFHSPYWRPLVLPYSIVSLLLSTLLLAISFHKQLIHFMLFMGICFVAGMSYESIGVHTGWLFGNYTYGENLGPKIWDVPLIIGINWGLLCISSGILASVFTSSHFWRAIWASLLMVGLDFLIEPVAMKSGYWMWENGHIPVYNYICWFVLSFPVNFLFTQFAIHEQNRVAIGLYFIFAAFFAGLNWI
ncbi:MAG: carotenoid biosynthesis protein [Bacteroidota bacterium]